MIMSKFVKRLKEQSFGFLLAKCIYMHKNKKFTDLIRFGSAGIIYRNINYNPIIRQRRALLCYMNNDNDNLQALVHTNIEERYVIEKYFIDNNYVVDICDCKNDNTLFSLRENEYDIVWGFGKSYQMAYSLWPNAFHIEYFTETPFWYSFMKESERISYYRERYRIKKGLYRTGMFYQKDDENRADAIICMCEESLFGGNIPIRRIFPHGMFNNTYEYCSRRDNNSILFFGTAG